MVIRNIGKMNNKKKTLNEVKTDIFSLVGNEYSVLSESYSNNKEKLLIRHNKCGHEYQVSFNKFQYGRRCPHCKGGKSISKEEFIQRAKEKRDDFEEFEFLGEYKNTETEFLFLHKKCGNTFMMTPHKFITGRNCPHCYRMFSESKGVRVIRDWLKKNSVEFFQEFQYPGCIYKRQLYFDFFLKSKSGREIVIEYDGDLHFIPYEDTPFYKERLEETHKRDETKNQFCNDHNIFILRIPYYNFRNINKILNETILPMLND